KGGDPNGFDGPVTFNGDALELVNPWRDNARGLGLRDLCRAVRDGTPQRASGERGLQGLETLLRLRRGTRDPRGPRVRPARRASAGCARATGAPPRPDRRPRSR